jgi:hypothetical protein
MQYQSPEDMRREAQQLVEAADTTSDPTERKSLASRAFALAQQAEAIERVSRSKKESPR